MWRAIPLALLAASAAMAGAEGFRPDFARVATQRLRDPSRVALRLAPGQRYEILERSGRDTHLRVADPDLPGRAGWVRYSPAETRDASGVAPGEHYSAGWAAIYRDLEGRRDQALEEGLRDANRTMWTLGYDSARDVMFSQIDNRGGRVRCVYTGLDFQAGKRPAERPDGSTMNTEHTWPQSSFDQREPMRSDLHHLFPTQTEANGIRSAKRFAELADDEGEAVGALGARTTEEAFEPPAAHKGNVARAMFYFAVQHRRDIPHEVERVLRRWHRQDPVDDAERRRNRLIYSYQLSRNYFVDHPELVERISDF